MSKDKELFGCGCEDENCDCAHDELKKAAIADADAVTMMKK